MANLNIYRAEVIVATVSIDEKTVLQTKLMNEDIIASEFVTSGVIPIALGDYITYSGKKYYLNTLPAIKKRNEKTFKYNAVFQSELYDLNQKLLISSDGLSDFSYAADPVTALTLIVDNMNINFVGWEVGEVEAGDVQVLQFFNDTCRTALSKIADAFAYEFEVIDKTINFKKAIGTVQDYTFEYGRNKGLYEIERRQVQNKSVFTRVYGFGGTKNIPYTYRDHAKRLVFEERYLEKNVAIYGLKEGHFTDDNIYPQRTADITAVNMVFTDEDAFNVLDSYVEDSTLNFDLNDYLLEGQTAKIVFKSGALSGYQFEIYQYDHDTKRIYFNPFAEGDGYTLPSLTAQPEVGDSYTLVDIKMPGIYVIEAEQALREATQRYIDENSVPKQVYIVKIDPKYAKANAVSIKAGDLVEIVDTQLGIERHIRISQISFPIVNPFKITAIIADFIPYSLQQLTNVSLGRMINNIRNVFNTVNNTNNNVTNNQTVNITNNEYPQANVVVINGRNFYFSKAVYNILNPTLLEYGDVIYGNYWDANSYVGAWRFTGTDKSNRVNYIEIETIDTSSPIIKTILNNLKVKSLTELVSPQYLLSLDADGYLAKTPLLREEQIQGSRIDVTVGGDYEIDLNKGSVFRILLEADTTFTFANLPTTTNVKAFTVIVDGLASFAPTWPAYCTFTPTSNDPGAVRDRFIFDVIDGTASAEDIIVTRENLG